ncbi:recombination protein NinG [Phytobacter ursingii]
MPAILKKRPRRKCTVCREWFEPVRAEQYVCSYECACIHGKAANDAAKAEKQRKEKKRHHDGQYHAGHFRTTGASPELRFDEDNCHKQCSACNNHLSGNLTAYRPALIAKIGQARFDALMGPHALPKWNRDDYIRIRDEYRAKLRDLKKQEAA